MPPDTATNAAHATPQPSEPATPRLRTLLDLAWPIVLARATQSVVGFCDALMVAPLGEEALAAVTTGALDIFTFVMLPMGTVFILQSFAAQLRGRGDLEAVRRYASYGLVIAVAAGLFALSFTTAIEPIVASLDYTPGVQQAMVRYLEPRLLSVTAMVGVEAINNWYGGLGNTRISLMVGILIMVLNVFGNYALIEPRFGLPGYGVTGAAWASAGASWIGFAFVLVLLSRNVGHDLPPGRYGMRASELWRVLRFGLPSGVNWFLEFAAFAFFINVVVGHLGTTVLAAFNVVLQISGISFMPAFGIASAGAILVGEAIGRSAHQQIWPIVRMTLASTSAWMVSAGLVYVLFPDRLMGVFQPSDRPAAELVTVGATMLALAGLWQLFDAVAITLSECLRAAGDTTWPMAARIVLSWIFFAPLSYWAVFVVGGEVITIMVSVIAYIVLLAGVLAYRYRSGRWRNITLVESEPRPT